LGLFSTLERELDAKFAEYDSFIASQKEFNQDISFQVASNSQRLNDLEEALAKESNSPTAARLDELENKLNSIAAEGTPTIVAIATAVNDEHGAETVMHLKNPGLQFWRIESGNSGSLLWKRLLLSSQLPRQ
jgi:hypothetical protein